jgi:hypothetical protein
MRVSAENITALTSSPDFADDVPPAPSVRELFNGIRLYIDRLEDEGHPARAAQKDRLLEFVLQNKPEGFSFAPAYYAPVERENRTLVRRQFNNARKYCLKFAARYTPDLLADNGICKHGIRLMFSGLSPRNQWDQPYQFSVDHVIECAGSGKWAQQAAYDPHLPQRAGVKFLVNHIDNQTLMSEEVHWYKNALVAGLQSTAMKQGGWYVTLAPMHDDHKRCAYIAPPQPMDHPLRHLQKLKMALQR